MNTQLHIHPAELGEALNAFDACLVPQIRKLVRPSSEHVAILTLSSEDPWHTWLVELVARAHSLPEHEREIVFRGSARNHGLTPLDYSSARNIIDTLTRDVAGSPWASLEADVYDFCLVFSELIRRHLDVGSIHHLDRRSAVRSKKTAEASRYLAERISHLESHIADTYAEWVSGAIDDAVSSAALSNLEQHGLARCHAQSVEAIGISTVGEWTRLDDSRKQELIASRARDKVDEAIAELRSYRSEESSSVPWLRGDDARALPLLALLCRLRTVRLTDDGTVARLGAIVQAWDDAFGALDPEATLTMLLVRGRTTDAGEPPNPAITPDDVEAIDRVVSQLDEPEPAAGDVIRDFDAHTTDYYSLLASLVDRPTWELAPHGDLPHEVVARVEDQPLDLSLIAGRLDLRGYQSFGAKFALVQKRTIIGDAMGLGKTIQAIAAIAHLQANGGRHFLVVSPLSVLLNWEREVRTHSRMNVSILHGPTRNAQRDCWLAEGGIALTTYGSLNALGLDEEQRFDMTVVDEAHYVKNPSARRSLEVSRLLDRSERALLLTGTPLENHLDEMLSLVKLIRPDLSSSAARAAATPARLRDRIAPTYLRRRTEEVLHELPPLTLIDELLPLGQREQSAYEHATADGNLMAMRQASFAGDTNEAPMKLRRIVEIVDSALAEGLSVLIFSYFRRTLDLIHDRLGPSVIGQLTGDTSPVARLSLIDELQKAASAVLLGQIEAGGTGLNIPHASVVILCEPQVKPSLESQAIGRAHRMGQLRPVVAHRLIAADSIDERLVALLQGKSDEFDLYANISRITELSDQARDTEVHGRLIDLVTEEQRRLTRNEEPLATEMPTDP